MPINQDCLSSSDAERLKDIKVVFKSNEGEFLSYAKRIAEIDEYYKLVEENSDGSVPEDAILSYPRVGLCSPPIMDELEKLYQKLYREKWKRKKVSAGMSEYLWPSDEGDTKVEFRSPVPGFPPRGQLRVVCTNMMGSGHRKRKAGGEYCLATDKDGTVKWLPESECVDGIQIWTVHLFERRAGEVLYLRDQLQRTATKVYYNCEFNYIGGNVNVCGTQTIGNVTTSKCTNQLSGFRKVYQMVQKFSHSISSR